MGLDLELLTILDESCVSYSKSGLVGKSNHLIPIHLIDRER
jgi:hypothetical protein